MNDCKRFEDRLASLMSGDLESDERTKTMRHLGECQTCADLFALHAELDDIELPAAAEADFARMRRDIRRSLRQEPGRGWTSRLPRLGWGGLRLQTALPVAVAALAIGFLMGRFQSTDREFEQARLDNARMANDNQIIAGQLEFAALQNRRVEQSAASPYTFSDLQVREIEGGRLELAFDVSTHLELVRDKSDPLVAELLVQALVNPSPMGTRLEAISLVRSLEPKVRDALIVTMLEDESLPVRIAALEKLDSQPMDSSVNEAFLEVLETEESVQMRLLAIDYLTREEVAPQRLESAVLAGRPEPGNAIFARAQNYFARF